MITNAKILGMGRMPADYHGQKVPRGTPDFVLSSSSLREFGHCPSRWKAGYEPPDSESKRWGSLLDMRLLTPGQFAERFAVKPPTYTNDEGEVKPWNANSNTCKKWLKDHQNLEIVSGGEMMDCNAAVKRIRADEIIAAFLDASDVQVHIRAEWTDEKTGRVIPVQALLDLVPRTDSEFFKSAGDLKTTRNAGVLAWQRWCNQADYHVQAAYNRDMLCAVENGGDFPGTITRQEEIIRPNFCFIVQENFAPWQYAKRMLDQDSLEDGRTEYKRLLAAYCSCLKYDRWPGYDDHDEAVQGWTIVRREPWMASAGQFAPQFNFEEPAAEAPALLEAEGVTP
jgi:hypothetical protein